MKVSIIFRLSTKLERLILGSNVTYNPNCDLMDHDSLSRFLLKTLPDVLIVRASPALGVLRKWRSHAPQGQSLTVICVADGGLASNVFPVVDGISLHCVDSRETAHPEMEAMLLAESLSHERFFDEHVRGRETPESVSHGGSVTLVGGGVVNLITAYYLINAGYTVTVLEGAPDPAINEDWRRQGCTFGGSDARVFSLNEGRHHQFKGYQFANATNTQFDLRVQDGGWLIHSPSEHNALTRDWIDQSRRVPLWLLGRFNRDIISFNQESAPLWRKMMADAPELFQGVGFYDGLLRLYATREQYSKALVSEGQIGSVLRELDLDSLALEFPSLRDGMEAGNIAGVLDVVGFSVSVQKFSRALGKYITTRGAKLVWGAQVTEVMRDQQGRVSGLQLDNNVVIRSSHYIVSPGAFGNDILAGFRSENKIAAVAGAWLTLPDSAETKLDRPLKISRKGFAANGAAEGANIIGGMDANGNPLIHVSSGHGFLGVGSVKVDSAQLLNLSLAVHETAQQYFPRQYKWAAEGGYLSTPVRYCIRPWTATGLGLFEMAPSTNGGMTIVTGGHNTGGFAQAPSVGQAVIAALSGNQHPMHALYAPDRLEKFQLTLEESLVGPKYECRDHWYGAFRPVCA